MPTWIIYLLLTILLVILSAFFSLVETVFSSINRFKFEVKANNGSKNAKLVLWVDDHFDSTLVTVLIGNNAVSVVLSMVTTFLFVDNLLTMLDNSLASLIGSLVITIILYIFGETLPKIIGRQIPNKIATWAAYPLSALIILLYPITALFRGISFVFKKIFKSAPEPEMTEEEFQNVIEFNENHGVL